MDKVVYKVVEQVKNISGNHKSLISLNLFFNVREDDQDAEEDINREVEVGKDNNMYNIGTVSTVDIVVGSKLGMFKMVIVLWKMVNDTVDKINFLKIVEVAVSDIHLNDENIEIASIYIRVSNEKVEKNNKNIIFKNENYLDI